MGDRGCREPPGFSGAGEERVDSLPSLCPIRPDSQPETQRVEGLAEGEEEEIGMTNPGEEARAARPARDPGAPTAAEREAHEATHLPFRIWCPECVAGRRDNPAHRKVPEDENAVPEVMLDYAFVRREGETERATVLLLKDRRSRAMRAWVMQHKGASTEEAVDRGLKGIIDFGHRGAILVKTDNEPALIALRDALLARLPEGAAPVLVPVRESESNGAIENGVKMFKGLLRVHLAALERKSRDICQVTIQSLHGW